MVTLRKLKAFSARSTHRESFPLGNLSKKYQVTPVYGKERSNKKRCPPTLAYVHLHACSYSTRLHTSIYASISVHLQTHTCLHLPIPTYIQVYLHTPIFLRFSSRRAAARQIYINNEPKLSNIHIVLKNILAVKCI